MNILFGNSIQQAVEHVVGKAWKQRTPQAMREASIKLAGIETFLVMQADNVSVHRRDLLALSNERLRCEQAAQRLEEGTI